jgi:hypothetical protein
MLVCVEGSKLRDGMNERELSDSKRESTGQKLSSSGSWSYISSGKGSEP